MLFAAFVCFRSSSKIVSFEMSGELFNTYPIISKDLLSTLRHPNSEFSVFVALSLFLRTSPHYVLAVRFVIRITKSSPVFKEKVSTLGNLMLLSKQFLANTYLPLAPLLFEDLLYELICPHLFHVFSQSNIKGVYCSCHDAPVVMRNNRGRKYPIGSESFLGLSPARRAFS